MKKLKGIVIILALSIIILAPVFCRPIQVLAAEANISFGSESYSKRNNEEFPIGVYIRGESKVGVYYVEVQYDTERMRYVGGGDSEQDGVVILRGTGLRDSVKYMLRFQAIGGGEAGIRIRYAKVREAVENGGGEFAATSFGAAPITISGTDEMGISFFDRVAAEDALNEENGDPEGGGDGNPEDSASGEGDGGPDGEGSGDDIPVLAAVDTGDGRLRYIVNHSEYIPDAAVWPYRTIDGTCGSQQVTFLTNAEGTVQILYLMEEIFMDGVLIAETFQPYAYSSEDGMMYPCQEAVRDGEIYFYLSPYACSEWPEELTLRAITEDHVFFVMDMEGKAGFYQLDRDRNLVEWNPEASRVTVSVQTRKLFYILAAAFAVMAAVCIGTYRAVKGKEKGKGKGTGKGKGKVNKKPLRYPEPKEGPKKQKENEIQDLEYFDLDDVEGIDSYDVDWDRDEDTGDDEADLGGDENPVISVQNVTMIFHISTSNASSVKEYLIQRIKRKVMFRELTALDHISFDVFKGEIVGIIGTNGSGKSTLLRIVSGALNPSGGRVVVDRRKVQLLTLGAGFDMELSAKENVYLNGAIIGYSKEFLDAHYEEIVEFAELQDFMEEKVKNFSSGMVSRLGFAIATAGDAAEILILDEVLSVGDEFFKKKSLQRIKEMIHGGSTVLMVSHGMGTIMENCTKAVWIEKGKMQMMGEAKVVCGAYQKM